jgi:putative heme iron utilization protein
MSTRHAEPDDVFPPEVVTAVTGHLNDDHSSDLLAIARVHGATPTATAARAVGVDRGAVHLDVEAGDRTERVRVPFPRRAEERADLRVLLVELTDTARTTEVPR